MSAALLRRHLGRAAVVLGSLLVAAAWAFPVYWMVLSALTPNARLRVVPPSFWPSSPTLTNLREVVDGSFPTALRMSLAITGVTVVAVLALAFLAALAISRFRFRGRTSIVLAGLVGQMH
ncbi:MAG TPA: carbohydrate ABC transporter permease, partial [Actinotalea sp.]|nr:carbohydrate ABC transporter permease [Actinotalea sp.]